MTRPRPFGAIVNWAALLAALFLWATPAAAQSFRYAACNNSEAVIADLAQKYGEVPGGEVGVTTVGEKVTVFADPDEQTWSLVLFSKNGRAACIVLAGIGPFPMPPFPGLGVRN